MTKDIRLLLLAWVRRRLEINDKQKPLAQVPKPRALTLVDQRLRVLVEDRLRALGCTTATVTHQWGAEADMWFVEISPHEPKAAFVSLAFDGYGLVSVVAGRTWFEMFPGDDDLFDELSSILDAVFAGEIIEQGLPHQTAAVIGTGKSKVKVGAWPAARGQERRYAPYT